jgi:hypothetical protein
MKEMEIGRSNVRHTQRDHTTSLGRHGVWAPGAKPIWASGDVPRQQAGNTTAVAPIANSFRNFLHYGGRPNTWSPPALKRR